jgi:FkbM family methyltransferase
MRVSSPATVDAIDCSNGRWRRRPRIGQYGVSIPALPAMALSFSEKWHMRHRCWRCRFKSEAPSIRFLLDAPLAGGTLVDVGANMGVFSYYLSRAAGPAGSVYAFEAQPELGPHLRAVARSFGLANLHVVNEGLSSRPGVLRMRREEAGSGRASFHHAASEQLEELEIPVTTLDTFFANTAQKPIRFIKCDVEGHELDVFRGAERILKSDGPMLLFECHHDQATKGDLFAFLSGLGYDGVFYHVDPRDHQSVLRKTRGSYVHYASFARYAYARPGVLHRNYIFMKDRARLDVMLSTGGDSHE